MLKFNCLVRGAMMASAVLVSSAASAIAPADAAADGPIVRANFQVSASNGYVLRISAYEDEVSVTARGSFGEAEYTVPGRVTPDRIRASFGKLGRVAVEFRPSGSFNRRVPPGRCEGKPRTLQFGTFVGTIRFAGEGGYAKAHVRRGWGNRYVERRWKCSPPKQRGGGRCVEEEGDGDAVTLDAASPRHRATLTAYASRSPRERGFTFIGAETEERRGRMEIQRRAMTGGPERIFTYAPDLTTATLSPPLPFSGSATYERDAAGAISWTGDLTVSLPGAPEMALAGPAFQAELEQLEPSTLNVCFFRALAQPSDR